MNTVFNFLVVLKSIIKVTHGEPDKSFYFYKYYAEAIEARDLEEAVQSAKTNFLNQPMLKDHEITELAVTKAEML
jgi:hypothetical protein